MVTDSAQFWSGPQGAARFKHAVVKGQVGAFTGKLGHAHGGRISYIDGYAGPGAYDDGSPGSPTIALDIADEMGKADPPIELFAQFIEQNRNFCASLEALLTARGYPHWPVHHGDCRKKLSIALNLVDDEPLLVFLDPFGLGVPFRQLIDLVASRDDGGRGRRPTEVIANFSVAALTRLGGFLNADFDDVLTPFPATDIFGEPWTSARTPEAITRLKRQQKSHLQNLDDFLGGAWWRALHSSTNPTWIEEVLTEWMRRISQEAKGWRGMAVPVADHWNSPAAYYLVLLTTNSAGFWEFNEVVSRAYERMRKATFDEQPEQPALFGDTVAYVDPGPAWVEELKSRAREVIDKNLSGTCAELMEALYGPLLGKARTPHLRAALKALHSEGLLDRAPVGALDRYRLTD